MVITISNTTLRGCLNQHQPSAKQYAPIANCDIITEVNEVQQRNSARFRILWRNI